MDLKSTIREIQDFPKEGINFKDITTLLKDPLALKATIDAISENLKDKGIEIIAGPESRGFIVGVPVACQVGAGFVPVRKPGKLPAKVERYEYELEYGTDVLEIHHDAIKPGQKVAIVDDLLATGGTVLATARLIESLGGIVVSVQFLMELNFLNGREKLQGYEVQSLITYDE
ncbi:adenine phosphoribosyltransferase [Anoxynatronum buryatiense]|uniref:Adenine phosphoribosyltransferase n=1 Tax=Anoxynatronum buryatiense TaxID=489973 RepID=A0AA45WUQ8_9CLOT|nr:adenine phosphoribosyltransferase [Anoxynatronum buryatiense]SMP49369.1 adenine phosphoribosyltransferase [Anoxynatronum buryatiense]